MSPLLKYQTGLRSSRMEPRTVSDADKLRLDFMPLYERSVGRKGITIDRICYWSDILRPWVETRDPKDPGKRRRFTIRRDPRDISVVWLWDREMKSYHRIPYRNLSHPATSVWELRDAHRRVSRDASGPIDEDQIFDAYESMRQEEASAARRTKVVRRNQVRRLDRTQN
jgi:putative transposase